MFKLNNDFALRDQGASNALGLDVLPRHRWYFVKEGFSPMLVEKAVVTDGIEQGEVLLDPFSGSGTVPLTAALIGLNARGFEVNPFLRFLTATKLRQARPTAFRKASQRLLTALGKPTPSHLENYSTFTEGNRWGRWLFPINVLRTFESGRLFLTDVSLEHRDLLKLALIGGAMDCCNATPDGKCLRYAKGWANRESSASDFIEQFKARAEIIATDLDAEPIDSTLSKISLGDSRQLITAPTKEKFRLCVTSPPYLNSFDYSDVYRPELFLGRFVDTNKALMKIRLKTVRSHVQANWKSPKNEDFGTIYRKCILEIRETAEDLWNHRIPEMVQAYFEDMEKILRGLRQRADDKSSVWLVVSTSAYAGIEVPVDLILAEIGQRSGWFLREVGVLRYLRSASQHVKHVKDENRKSVPLRESVVIFDASKKGTTSRRRGENVKAL